MRSLTLIALLACTLAHAGQQRVEPKRTRTLTTQRSSVVSSQWRGVSASDVVLECRRYSGSGWGCFGAAFSVAVGTPTVSYPDGAKGPALSLDGSTYLTAGDVLDSVFASASNAAGFTVLLSVKADSVAAAQHIVAKRSTAVDQDAWGVTVSTSGGGVWVFGIYKNGVGADSTLATTSVISVGAWTRQCWYYRPVADGTSVIGGAIGGTGLTEKTNAKYPVIDVTSPIAIGARPGATPDRFFDGDIGVITILKRGMTAAECVAATR